MVTKGQIIEDAFAELALAGYVFDIDPEEQQNALRTLNRMMGTWDQMGVRLGYAMTNDSERELKDDSNLPDGAIEAVTLGLAMRLSASKGKQLSPTTIMFAKQAFNALMASAAMPGQQSSRIVLLGAGSRSRRGSQNPFSTLPAAPITAADGDESIDFN